jgi:hypothetical protein
MYQKVMSAARCCGTAVAVVTDDGFGGARSVPPIFFGVSCLATLLPSLGSAKLVGHSWIWSPKRCSAS